MSSTLLVFIQYTLSGNNNFHKTILKKQKCESLSRECVQTSKSRRRDISRKKGCRKCYKIQERSIFFFQSSRYPNNSVTDNTDQEKKKSQNKTYIHCFNFIHNNLGVHCFR